MSQQGSRPANLRMRVQQQRQDRPLRFSRTVRFGAPLMQSTRLVVKSVPDCLPPMMMMIVVMMMIAPGLRWIWRHRARGRSIFIVVLPSNGSGAPRSLTYLSMQRACPLAHAPPSVLLLRIYVYRRGTAPSMVGIQQRALPDK